ncbi:MAG: penicillin-binding protein 1C [Bacteroidales bacterium]|nr:penicillin-binding protein 1C [Bacteroidales bacterium]
MLALKPRNLFDSPVSAILEDREGRLLGARIAADGQWRFPAADSVPVRFAKALVCFEDKRFYRHPGIDPFAVARAISLNASSGRVRSGASTITMQVIRLSRGNRPRTIGEKMVEAILALRLDAYLTKPEILALYAANAPFGGNVVGVEAAAWRYFGRPASDLSWAESATLAVLPNAPALIHPGRSRSALLAKRNRLLEKLFEEGTIDRETFELSCEEPLPDKPHPLPDLAYHYLETLRKAGGDKRFITQIDGSLQQRAEDLLERHAAQFATNHVYNLAAVVLDVHSGEPVCYVGNVGGNGGDGGDGGDGLSHGTHVDVVQAPRSSGSTLKPLLYAAMLDEGDLLPGTLVADIPFHAKDFTPNNFNHTFDGAVTAESVIRRSLNVPSVRMLQDYGIEKFIDLLQRLGFSTITRGADTYGLSLILGGAEIRLGELASCYASLARKLEEGERRRGGAGDSGSGLAGNGNAGGEKSGGRLAGPDRDFPLSRGAIWCTFDALTEVNRPEEEGDWHSFHTARQVAWKTGTSYGNRDAWSVGVTPDYVVAVWAGNCNGEGRPLLTGVGYAAPVMFDLFGLLPYTGWFEMPADDLEEVEVCALSGHPATDLCRADGTKTIWAPLAPHRPDPCPYHKLVHLDPQGRWQVDSDCWPVSEIVSVPRFVLPPAQEWYYMHCHSEYSPLPPFHPNYAGPGRTGVIAILYPQHGMQVAAPVALDSKSQGIVFSAAHADPNATLYWHLDGNYLGETAHGEHKIRVVPDKGPHTLTLVDANGHSAAVRFTAM